ncbi:hypothetical protein JOB18_037727 [Solea senegalensis]|uniref:Uncharacterized protein n=1 Tax=Solea senegalensis TaxID=28829 RepID=A0AAV6SNV4_SOLSE|nr:hypothetical protein JOB18_037727 [Solea senegalensis]
MSVKKEIERENRNMKIEDDNIFFKNLFVTECQVVDGTINAACSTGSRSLRSCKHVTSGRSVWLSSHAQGALSLQFAVVNAGSGVRLALSPYGCTGIILGNKICFFLFDCRV